MIVRWPSLSRSSTSVWMKALGISQVATSLPSIFEDWRYQLNWSPFFETVGHVNIKGSQGVYRQPSTAGQPTLIKTLAQSFSLGTNQYPAIRILSNIM
eukprot:scaffold29000_cov253-Amphora_coffeaeformis.AAC.2